MDLERLFIIAQGNHHASEGFQLLQTAMHVDDANTVNV
jgi:hypothetical protein